MAEKKGQTDRVKELTDRLEAGIKEVFASGHYREYLSAVHKFHSYSYNNSMLILMQKPEASYVWDLNAGTLGRHVKGEKELQSTGSLPVQVRKLC